MNDFPPKLLVLLYLIVPFILFSCQEENLEEQPLSVHFTVSSQVLSGNGRVAEINDACAVVITLLDAANKPVLEMKKMAIHELNGRFVTESVKLTPGKYRLTTFLVVGDNDEVLYIIPKEGSENAHMVNQPLPITIEVNTNSSNEINLVVLKAQASPEAYGYISFDIQLVETLWFRAQAFSVDEGGFAQYKEPHLVLTDALIEVYEEAPQEENKLYETTITPSNDLIEILYPSSTRIILRVSKKNHFPYEKSFSPAELEATLRDPLSIVLERKEPFKLIARPKGEIQAVFTPSANTDKLLFTTPEGLWKVNISNLDNPGDPVFIGNYTGFTIYEDHYGKLFLGNYVSADLGETWQSVAAERPNSYFVEMNGSHYGLNGKKLYRETANDQWEFIRELPFGGLFVFNCRLFAQNGLLVSDNGTHFREVPLEGLNKDEMGQNFNFPGIFSAWDQLYSKLEVHSALGYILEWNRRSWSTENIVYDYDAEMEYQVRPILTEEYKDYLIVVESNSLKIFDSCDQQKCEPTFSYFFNWEPDQQPPTTIFGRYVGGDNVFIQTKPDDEGYTHLFAVDLSQIEL